MSLINKKCLKVKVSNKVLFIEKTKKYFLDSGFTFHSQEKDIIKFKCGSLAGNRWEFNPLKWKSDIIIHITEEELVADFYIDTSKQMVTSKEEALWEDFITNYKRFLTEPNFEFDIENKKNLIATKKKSYQLVGFIFLVTFFGLSFGIIINELTGYYSFITFGAIFGGVFILNKYGFLKKIKK